MGIDWAALARVALISVAIAIGVVAMFAIGVHGVAKIDAGRDRAIRSLRVMGYFVAGAAHGICIVAVLYGLYLIIPQFH